VSVRVGVLASGRGSNFAALAAASAAGTLGADIVCLVTDNPSAAAIATAVTHGIPVVVIEPGARRARLSPDAEAHIVAALRDRQVNLVCLAGFMRIVGPVLLAAYPRAILNIHPSLLPSFPGLDAPAQAVAHGVKVSGCTVHYVDAGVDSGPIVLQAAVPVHDEDTATTLAARILEREHVIYAEAVRLWAARRLSIADRRVHVLTAAARDPYTAGAPAETPEEAP
jgi:phosphoribosylglycinamide formyltransferase-1